jgi:hypothetical protein
VTAKYSSSATGEMFEETQVIDLQPYLGINHIVENDFHDLVEAVKTVQETLAKLQASGHSRVLTSTPDEYDQELSSVFGATRCSPTSDERNDLLDILSRPRPVNNESRAEGSTDGVMWADREKPGEEERVEKEVEKEEEK